MKRAFYVIAIVFISAGMLPSDSSLCQIQRQMGVGIYIQCKPVRDYDTICKFEVKHDYNSYPGPSVEQKVIGIQAPLEHVLKKAVNRAKRKKDIDGIITNDGKHAVGIKYKETNDKSLYNKAKVNVYKSYSVFMQSKPLKTYATVGAVRLNKKLSLEFNGYNSVDQMLDSLIANFNKVHVGKTANGIITESGIEAEFILLTEE